MASSKVLESKKTTVAEIVKKIQNSESVILFHYQGLTVEEMTELRRELLKNESEVKVYKNTLLKRAMDEINVNIDTFLEGPNAVIFGKTLLEPIKVISQFAKDHKKVDIRVGVISGDVASIETIKEYAAIPSREGLLTMLAGGMIQYVKDLAIGLNLYAEKLEGKEN